MPVMGLIFLRHAYSRFLAVKDEIEAGLPTRGGRRPPLQKADFAQKGAIYLRPEAQFDYLVELTDADDRAEAVEHAMESIEKDHETLRGQLPKAEYRELDNAILGQLLHPQPRRAEAGERRHLWPHLRSLIGNELCICLKHDTNYVDSLHRETLERAAHSSRLRLNGCSTGAGTTLTRKAIAAVCWAR